MSRCYQAWGSAETPDVHDTGHAVPTLGAMAAPLALRFVTSAPSVDGLPASRAEVAVVGRSNVGKSSLVNALANRKRLAHVSSTPGRTQMLNLYELDDGATFVDLPGYGYAKASKATREQLPARVEGYLLGRDELETVLVLVDGEIGPTKLDVSMLEWLAANDVPHVIVATKADKVKASQRTRRRRDLSAACGLEPDDVVWVSATSGAGIPELRDLVRSYLR